MSTYSEKLRDPRWQKTRLEILARDYWSCQICHDTKTTLNVHHRYYDYGVEPWDYPKSALITLCQPCHELEEKYKRDWDATFIRTMRSAGCFNRELSALDELFSVEELNEYDWRILTDYLRVLLPNRKTSPEWDKISREVIQSWLDQRNKAA
jgi:hypothetical protein